MAVRSVERTVETVLLPAVEAMTPTSPEYCFAWRYATGWLAAAQRVAPPSTRDEGVLIFDASQSMDMDGLYVQALELFLRRAGLRVLTLPVELDSTRVGSALRALRPQAMVLGGHCASLEAVGRVVYATRQSGGELQVFDYRGALPETGASTVARIGPGPCRSGAHVARAIDQHCAGDAGETVRHSARLLKRPYSGYASGIQATPSKPCGVTVAIFDSSLELDLADTRSDI